MLFRWSRTQICFGSALRVISCTRSCSAPHTRVLNAYIIRWVLCEVVSIQALAGASFPCRLNTFPRHAGVEHFDTPPRSA